VFANQQPHRWLVGADAVLASVVWFTALSAGAHKLTPLLAKADRVAGARQADRRDCSPSPHLWSSVHDE